MSTILAGTNSIGHRLLCTIRQSLIRPDAVAAINRHFSQTTRCSSSYYDALRVSPNASQNDIKKAYYALSMEYHPDRNKGSDRASIRFREVNEAYEVLCNSRTRAAYDEGCKTATTDNYRPTKEDLYASAPAPQDDAQTKFYRQHMRRSDRPASYGNKYQDLDTWSAEHYSRAFHNQRLMRRGHELRKSLERTQEESLSMNMALFLIFLIGIVATIFYKIVQTNDKKR